MRVHLDKVASVTANVPLRRDARLGRDIIAREGYLVAGRIHGDKTVYNEIEDLHGRLVTLHDGDIIAGALGHRNALHGYSGVVPDKIARGDRLHVLNRGGVIGQCTSENPDVGPPFEFEVLGTILVFPGFEKREGVPAHIGMNAIQRPNIAQRTVPVVYVAGTCMNSGKTFAACHLIRRLVRCGFSVGACKLTGVSLRRDVLEMQDYGARWAASFTDAGVVSTSAENAVHVAQTLLGHLADAGAQVIVAELGDGIMGEYGVAEILASTSLMQAAGTLVLCANDPVGTWGGQKVLSERFGLDIDVVSGPTTDNAVGTRFITDTLGLIAINARSHGEQLGQFVADRVSKQLAETVS